MCNFKFQVFKNEGVTEIHKKDQARQKIDLVDKTDRQNDSDDKTQRKKSRKKVVITMVDETDFQIIESCQRLQRFSPEDQIKTKRFSSKDSNEINEQNKLFYRNGLGDSRLPVFV